MPMLADIDDPPRSQVPGVLLGILVVAPFVAAAAYFGLPALRAAVVGAMNDYDDRLRQEDAYMTAVCTDALVLERDEELCECALAIEYPSLDCRAPFLAWSLERQFESCADPDTRKTAISFCACVETLHEELEGTEDLGERRHIQQRYGNCAELDGALYLPGLEQLADWTPAPDAEPAPEPTE